MKKYFYSIVVLFGLLSCDKEVNYDYFVINQCDEAIKVVFMIGRNDGRDKGPHSIVIPPDENILIYDGHWINGLDDGVLEWFFTEITIHKGDKISKVNYIDKDKWRFEPTSDSHANSYLTVYPEDFENE